MRLVRRGSANAGSAARSIIRRIDRPPRARRLRGSATIITCVLVAVSLAELAWIVAR